MLAKLFLITFLIIVLTGLVIAVHETGHAVKAVQTEGDLTEGAVGGTAPSEEVVVSDDTSQQDDQQDILNEVREEHKNAELSVDAGTTPDSAFYFIDKFFDDTLGDPLEVREEKIAEIEEMVEKGNIEAATEALENYEAYAGKLEKEISPEEREEARESSAAIANTLEEIKDKIPEEDREKFVGDVIEQERKVLTAADIADQISKLCGNLVAGGFFKEASKVCNLDEKGDDPEWLRGRKEGWNKQLEGDAQKFFDVLTQCMEITNDGKKGNSDECRCNEMPDAQAVLCVDIAAAEDACNDGNDESACDVSQPLIEEFMRSLPNNLKAAMEKAMNKFGQKNFERYGAPPKCKQAGAGDFVSCQEIIFRQTAPGPCLNALDRREIKPTHEACEKIIFEENTPKGCEGLSPEDCGDQYGGPGRGRGPGVGPGFDYTVCDAIKNIEAQLACYKDNTKKVGLHEDFYQEKQKFRKEFRSEGFKNYGEYRKQFHGKFDKGFQGEHRDEYVDFAKGEYQYKYGPEYDQRKEGGKSREEHQAKIDKFFAEVYPACQAEGKPWFCNGPLDNPCYCGEAYKYPSFDYQQQPGPGGPGDYKGQGCAPGQHLVTPDPARLGGSYCVYDERQPYQQPPPSEPQLAPTTTSPPPSEPATQPAPAPAPVPITGGVITGRVVRNPFLDYYFS